MFMSCLFSARFVMLKLWRRTFTKVTRQVFTWRQCCTWAWFYGSMSDFELSHPTRCTLSFDATVCCSVSARWANWWMTSQSRSYRRLSALRWRGRHAPFHNNPSRPEISLAVAGVLLFAVVCWRGSAEMGEASKKKQTGSLKKGWLLQPEGNSRVEGTDQTEICPTQNHPPPLWWADATERAPPASGFYPEGAAWSALGTLLCQQPSDCTIPVVWIAPLTATEGGADTQHLYLLYKLTWNTYALKRLHFAWARELI